MEVQHNSKLFYFLVAWVFLSTCIAVAALSLAVLAFSSTKDDNDSPLSSPSSSPIPKQQELNPR